MEMKKYYVAPEVEVVEVEVEVGFQSSVNGPGIPGNEGDMSGGND